MDARTRTLLEIEQQWWKHPGSKDAAIREHLDMSAVRFYQALRAIVLDPPADVVAEFGPVLRRVAARMQRGRPSERMRRAS